MMMVRMVQCIIFFLMMILIMNTVKHKNNNQSIPVYVCIQNNYSDGKSSTTCSSNNKNAVKRTDCSLPNNTNEEVSVINTVPQYFCDVDSLWCTIMVSSQNTRPTNNLNMTTVHWFRRLKSDLNNTNKIVQYRQLC